MADKLALRKTNYRVQRIVGRSAQEVTVPGYTNVPSETQYLLKPLLYPEVISTTVSVGKVRVSGQLKGFLSYVDSNEAVAPVKIQPMDFAASFAIPEVAEGDSARVTVVVDAVEVDKGDNAAANITAFISVSVLVSRIETLALITDVEDLKNVEKEQLELQVIIDDGAVSKYLQHQLELATIAKELLAAELRVSSLKWHIEEGRLLAETLLSGVLYYIGESGKLESRNFKREHSVSLELDQEVEKAKVWCVPELESIDLGEDNTSVMLNIRLALNALGYKEECTEVVIDVAGADYVRQTLAMETQVGESDFGIDVQGLCQLPGPADDIRMASPVVRILESRTLDDKVLVRGLLTLLILYSDEQGVDRAVVKEDEFNQFIPLDNVSESMDAAVRGWCEGVELEQGEGEVHYTASLSFWVDVSEFKEISPITDLHIVDAVVGKGAASIILYRTKACDTLFSVAKKFNVTQSLLQEYNNISGQELKANTKLMIPLYKARRN